MASNVNPKRKSKNDSNPSALVPSETHSVLFEWPLTGLKSMFESTKSDTKSRVVKSTPFGGGRWTVLFYAQSGTDQFCSLYLNAEPLQNERNQSLNANSWMQASKYDSQGKGEMEDSWSREGNYRFTFTIQTPDKSVVLGTKEANNHMFSMKTSNWGWAQFAKRDTVYYGNHLVKNADQFIITVSITASAEKPRLQKPISLSVPPPLVQAMGSLLDDPDHSDVVFHLVSQRRQRSRRSKNGSLNSPSVKKIYAIKKILSSRCEYFSDMFEGGFAEAECAEYSDDEPEIWQPDSPSRDSAAPVDSTSNQHQDPYATDEEHPQHGEATQANTSKQDLEVDEFYSDEEMEDEAFILEDSDEELEGPTKKDNISPAFGFGNKGRSGKQTKMGSRGASNTFDWGSEGEDQEEEEEEQDEDEFDEVVGVSRPGVNPSTPNRIIGGTITPASTSNLAYASTSTTFNQENPNLAIQNLQQELNQTGELQVPAFGSLSAIDHPNNTLILVAGDGSAQAQNQGSTSNGASSSTLINPEIPTQSNLSRSNSHSNQNSALLPTPLPNALYTSTSQNFSHIKMNPASNTSTPVKNKQSAQRSNTVSNPGAKRGRGEGTTGRGGGRKRRKVVIQDAAYNTYKALLYYLYTDTITFAPLTSSFLSADPTTNEGDLSVESHHRSAGLNAENYQEEMIKAHKRRQAMIDWWCSQNPDKPSPCSAKAMYKLADKLQIPELKRRAQEHIAASLTVQNITFEAFCSFNAKFAEIRKMETDYLLQHWPAVKKTSAMKTIFFRSQAHPGLAEVWPYLLSQLEYKASGDDSDSESEQV